MIQLTQEQQGVFSQLFDYIGPNTNNYDFSRFKGYAGVGKTTVLSMLVEAYPKLKWGMTAPTNKAVKVMRKKSTLKSDVTYATIHSFLGLKRKIGNNGEVTFEKDYSEEAKNLSKEKSKIGFLIIDEVSMLNRNLLEKVLEEYNLRKGTPQHLKLIFAGDPFQLPPVNEKVPLVFHPKARDRYNCLDLELNTVMRQALDSPILGFVTKIRLDQGRTYTSVPPEFKLTTPIDQIATKYFKTEEFHKDVDFAKILAYSNAAVNKANNTIRKVLYNSSEKYVIGERLVFEEPYQEGKFKNSDEVFVVGIENSTKTISISTYGLDDEEEVTYKTIKLKVLPEEIRGLYLSENPNRKLLESHVSIIEVVHPESEKEFAAKRKYLKDIAIKVRNRYAWIELDAFESNFAYLCYNYALTVHKSQGSTFNNVFVVDDNIRHNPYTENLEKASLRYVAYSRASENAFVISI